jgi:hypothetical protein
MTIIPRLWEGSGLGNQLHRYVMARVLAKDFGIDFGTCDRDVFKGDSFMKIDKGTLVELPGPGGKDNIHAVSYEKPEVNDEGATVTDYSWSDVEWFKKRAEEGEVSKIIIDGEWQGEKYYEHRLDEIRDWLKVEPIDMPDDLCVIGFRGGEYVGVQDLFLPRIYWILAIEKMKEKYPNIRFEVHTDDVETAKDFFPDFECIHDIGLNWRSVRYAKHLIIANSSFFILPALLGEAKEIIAPKWWAGYNKGYWQLKQNVYKKFTYIHHED